MGEHPNASIVREFFDAQAAGDLETLFRLLSPELVWHLPRGGTRLSSTADVTGLDAVGEMSVRNLEASAGSFSFDVKDVFAGETTAGVVSHNTAAAGGRKLDLRMMITFRLVNGQIVEVWECVDDIDAFYEFWR